MLDASEIAATTFDRDVRAASACTIGGPAPRIRTRLRRLAVEVKTAARTISRLVGAREQSDASGGEARNPGARRRASQSVPRSRS